jgi:hypothetical protein
LEIMIGDDLKLDSAALRYIFVTNTVLRLNYACTLARALYSRRTSAVVKSPPEANRLHNLPNMRVCALAVLAYGALSVARAQQCLAEACVGGISQVCSGQCAGWTVQAQCAGQCAASTPPGYAVFQCNSYACGGGGGSSVPPFRAFGLEPGMVSILGEFTPPAWPGRVRNRVHTVGKHLPRATKAQPPGIRTSSALRLRQYWSRGASEESVLGAPHRRLTAVSGGCGLVP